MCVIHMHQVDYLYVTDFNEFPLSLCFLLAGLTKDYDLDFETSVLDHDDYCMSQNAAPNAAVATALHGGKPAYKHFKYNFISGSKHFSEGRSRGPYGWSKEKQQEQEKAADEMIMRMAPEALNDYTPSGLGYGENHSYYYKYLSVGGNPRPALALRHPTVTPRESSNSTPASSSSSSSSSSKPKPSASASRRPAPATSGWYDDEDLVIDESRLCFAASMGYGSTHMYVLQYGHPTTLYRLYCPLVAFEYHSLNIVL